MDIFNETWTPVQTSCDKKFNFFQIKITNVCNIFLKLQPMFNLTQKYDIISNGVVRGDLIVNQMQFQILKVFS